MARVRRGGVLVSLLAGFLASWSAAQTPPTPSPDAANVLVGNRTLKVFHRPDCDAAKRLPPRARVNLAGVKAAEDQGFRPCPTCRPDAPSEVPEAAPAPGSAPESVAPADGTPSFVREIAPILVGNCTGCHNPGEKDRRGGFDLSTFAALMAGGETGPAIAPGKPEESPLLQRVRGEVTPKMPPGDRNLAPETIARIEAWIKAGAKIDPGVADSAPLDKIAPTVADLQRDATARLSPEERDRRLEQTGRNRWKRASSSEPRVTPGTRLLLLSDIPEDRAKALVKAIDGSIVLIHNLLGPNVDTALGAPGKLAVFVFSDRNAYVEFVRSLENGQPDDTQQAHASLGGDSPYLAATDPFFGGEETSPESSAVKPTRSRSPMMDLMPSAPERSLAGLLSEQLGTSAVSRSGKPPQWLSLGVGAMLASTAEPRNPYYRRLRLEAQGVFRQGGASRTSEILGGQGEPRTIQAVGFSLLEWLYASRRQALAPFIREIQKDGSKLDDLLQRGFGASREQFLQAWALWMSQRYGGGR